MGVNKKATLAEIHNWTFEKNVINAILLVAVAIPAILIARYLFNDCIQIVSHKPELLSKFSNEKILPDSKSLDEICGWSLQHPLWTVNIIYFFNVNVLFWIVAVFQKGNTWVKIVFMLTKKLIDPYWQIIPLLELYFYAYHPMGLSDPWRGTIVFYLIWIWAIRLLHSYFRREEWNFGLRQDWRFEDICAKSGVHWYWISFFYVYIVQQPLLVGLMFPVYAVFTSEKQMNIIDILATVMCIAGIIIAYFADTQLREFMANNQRLELKNEPKVPVLNTGIWKYSRRPNYFGEQLFWWGIALFGINVGQMWTVIGTFLNSLVLAAVTGMTEKRILRNKAREVQYREYMKTTSVWVPWFKIKKE